MTTVTKHTWNPTTREELAERGLQRSQAGSEYLITDSGTYVHTSHCNAGATWRQPHDLNSVPDGHEFIIVPARRSGSYGAGGVGDVSHGGPVEFTVTDQEQRPDFWQPQYAAAFVRVCPGKWTRYGSKETALAWVQWSSGHARTGDHSGIAYFVAE
jgi:hypothetical protein